MRPIDADALESIIQEQVGKCMIKVFNPSVNLILQDIRNAPTIETEPDKGWISVKDRLPENDGLYIVCKTIRDHQIVFEARWQGGNWKSVVKNSQLDFITDWQPLPKPPKGE